MLLACRVLQKSFGSKKVRTSSSSGPSSSPCVYEQGLPCYKQQKLGGPQWLTSEWWGGEEGGYVLLKRSNDAVVRQVWWWRWPGHVCVQLLLLLLQSYEHDLLG